MANVNILFFNLPHLSVGRGVEVWLREVIDFLNKKRFKVKLITTDCCSQDEVKVDFEYKVIKLKRKFSLHLYDFNEIDEDIKWADIVYYVNNFMVSQIPLILHKKELYKKIIFGHHAKNDLNLTQKIYYSIANKFFKDFGYHHVLTKYYYDKLVLKGFKRAFVIPNFIDIEKFRPKEKKSELTVVSLGAVTIEKGLDTLQVVANKLRDVNIYLGGKDLPKGIILPKNVKYLGYIDNSKVELLSSSHVCLLPTKGETFSITLLECLATGNLVVTRDLPELREVSGNIPSVFFARNDQEFIDNILKVKEIYEKERGKFDELSLMSAKRASNFEKNKVLSDFENKLVEIYNTSSNLD